MHHDMPWNEFSITTPGLPVLTQNGLNKYLQGYQTPTSDHRMTRNTCQVCLSLCSTFCFSSISSQNNAKHLILELLGGSSREMRNLTARKQNIFNVTFTHYFRSGLHSSPGDLLRMLNYGLWWRNTCMIVDKLHPICHHYLEPIWMSFLTHPVVLTSSVFIRGLAED